MRIFISVMWRKGSRHTINFTWLMMETLAPVWRKGLLRDCREIFFYTKFHRDVVHTRWSFHDDWWWWWWWCEKWWTCINTTKTDEYARSHAFAWQTWWLTGEVKLQVWLYFHHVHHIVSGSCTLLASTQSRFDLGSQCKNFHVTRLLCEAAVLWFSQKKKM